MNQWNTCNIELLRCIGGQTTEISGWNLLANVKLQAYPHWQHIEAHAWSAWMSGWWVKVWGVAQKIYQIEGVHQGGPRSKISPSPLLQTEGNSFLDQHPTRTASPRVVGILFIILWARYMNPAASHLLTARYRWLAAWDTAVKTQTDRTPTVPSPSL